MAKEKIAAGVNEETIDKLKKIADENPKTEPSHRITRPRYKHPDTMKDALKEYPKHLVKIVNLVRSNSDVRRYTSLGILNYLCQKGVNDGTEGYVKFHWTKFSITINGLTTEYRYKEPFFLNCLIASFTSFANSAQKIIGEFCAKEMSEKFVQDDEDINEAISFVETKDNKEEDSE